MSHYSNFLFARPSFAEGVARLADFGGTLNQYNSSSSGQEADELALWADWCAVGEDMQAAINEGDAVVKKQQKKEKAGAAT
jgi:hypothetical protein